MIPGRGTTINYLKGRKKVEEEASKRFLVINFASKLISIQSLDHHIKLFYFYTIFSLSVPA
jgi:hypothetical protein